MAFYWSNMSVIEGGLELAGHGKDVQLEASCAELDTTPISNTDGYRTLIGGLKTGTVSLSLMQDLADDSVDETMWASLGSAGAIRSISSATDGGFAYLMRGITLSYSPVEGDIGGLAMTNIRSTVSQGPLVRGKRIHPSNVSRTASDVGTGRQLGAVIAGKSLYAALHVITVSGTSPTLDVIVQSDDNSGFTTPTTRITFSQAIAKGAQWGSVAGAVTDDYWRISYTIGGSDTPTFAFAVTAGIV